MKRVILAIFSLLLVGGVLAFALWPLGPWTPRASPVEVVAEGQESFARHLELGILYERHSFLDKAQGEYEQAAASEQAEIVVAAQAGLERVLTRQQNPWLKMQTAARTFLYWLGQNLLRLIIAGAVVWLIWLLVSRTPRRPGYLLLPFKDFTSDNLGKGLHALIHLTLQEAKHTHLRGQGGLLSSSERLEVPLFGTLSAEQDVLAGALSALDSFSVGGIDLPLGKMLLAVQRWVSTHEHVVTGSLHQHGEKLRLSAEIRKVTTGEVMQAWELSATAGKQPAAQVAALAAELAFRMLFALCPELEARTWRSLQLFMAGLRESQRYGVEVMHQSVMEKAAKLLTEALILDPGYTSAHYLLGIAYSNLGHYEEARDQFREVIKSGKLVTEATYNLGLALYHEFQAWANDKAITQFTRVQEDLSKEKRDGRWKLLLALAHCGLASAYAQRVEPLAEGKGPEPTEDTLAQVMRHCQTAPDLADDREEIQAATHHALGVAYLKAKQPDKAITELKAAIQVQPGYPVAYVHLAQVYADTQPDEAIRWLERAVRWHPGYEYAHSQLGNIRAQQGETEAAKEAYTQAPGIPDARNSLGEILAAQGNCEAALAEFQEAVKLNRRHARAWGNLAWWTVEAGKRDEDALREATGWARRALELNRRTPYEWLSHDVLGWVLMHRGRLKDAEQELARSIEGQGDRIQNRYHLACLYHKLGDSKRAKEALAEALRLPESSDWREKAVALMKELHQEAI